MATYERTIDKLAAEGHPWVLAAIDLIESIEIENTADEDANENSCIVLGNVSVTTLRTLGFEIPGEDRIVD
jgi:hypothetical protein